MPDDLTVFKEFRSALQRCYFNVSVCPAADEKLIEKMAKLNYGHISIHWRENLYSFFIALSQETDDTILSGPQMLMSRKFYNSATVTCLPGWHVAEEESDQLDKA